MDPTSELRRQLRQADEQELDRILGERAADLGSAVIEQAFRNPFLVPRHIDLLAKIPGIVANYAFRRELVAHPRSPRPLALVHVGGLYWADLARVSTDTRLHPLVRRAADRKLLERLPGLATGERIAIARRASSAVVAGLLRDKATEVMVALLENPRLTEAALLQLAGNECANPKTLAVLAGHPRWSLRIGVRRALCRNPKTPSAASSRLLARLPPGELRLIADDLRLVPAVRRCARQLLTGGSNPQERASRD